MITPDFCTIFIITTRLEFKLVRSSITWSAWCHMISWTSLVISPRTSEGLFDYISSVGSGEIKKADMKRSCSAPMISEIADQAGIRSQFDHPRVYCASALTNLTVDTGVASASRPLVSIFDVYISHWSFCMWWYILIIIYMLMCHVRWLYSRDTQIVVTFEK